MNEPPNYIVQLEESVWPADWQCDPWRTNVETNAKVFQTLKSARSAIAKAREYSPFSESKIIKLGKS